MTVGLWLNTHVHEEKACSRILIHTFIIINEFMQILLCVLLDLERILPHCRQLDSESPIVTIAKIFAMVCLVLAVFKDFPQKMILCLSREFRN